MVKKKSYPALDDYIIIPISILYTLQHVPKKITDFYSIYVNTLDFWG